MFQNRLDILKYNQKFDSSFEALSAATQKAGIDPLVRPEQVADVARQKASKPVASWTPHVYSLQGHRPVRLHHYDFAIPLG